MPDWRQILELIPLAVGVTKAGTPQGDAILRGFYEGQQERRHRSVQDQQLAGQEEYRRAQMANMEADNARQQQAFDATTARQTEMDALNRLSMALRNFQPMIAGEAETATDPTAAESALLGRAGSLETAFGVPQGQLSAFVPPMTPIVSERKKRRARARYEEFVKAYGPQATEAEGTLRESAGEFAGMTLAEVRQLAEAFPVQPGKKTPATPGSFEDYLTTTPERQQQIEGARKRYQQADDRPVGGGGPAGLTPNMESTVLSRLTKQWTEATKPARDMDRQVKLMRVGLDAARRGDLAQGAQAILVTFQKILDPTSVVRESEYMRSAAGQSLMNRVEGALEQLARGGAGVPLPELEKFARLAEAAATAIRGGYVEGVKGRLGRTADRYKIPRDIVFEDLPEEAEPAASSGVPRFKIVDVK